MTAEKIIGINQVVEQIGLSRSMIYLLMDPKSKYYDSSFPTPIRILSRRIGWIALEIDLWVLKRIEQRDESKGN